MSNSKTKAIRQKAIRQYVFRAGTRTNGVAAQVVGEELERIHSKHGALRASDVVEEARPADAALHPAFEWNDAIAAEEWRMHTARNLIRSVHVINEHQEPASVYVNVQTESSGREYQPVEVVVNRPDLYGMAVYEAQQRINAARKALDDLVSAAGASDIESKKLAAIHIAMQALATASGAVEALH